MADVNKISEAAEAGTITIDATGDNATRRVPPDQRRSLWNIAFVQAGYCIVMSGLYTGAALAAGLSFRNAIIAVLIGNAILTVYSALMGVAGAREGVSTSILARHSFGRYGSKVVGFVSAVTMLGWYAVQVGFFGNVMNAMFPKGGFITEPRVASLWGGILMMVTAYVGYKGLSILSNIAVPLIIIISTWGCIAAVMSIGGWNAMINYRVSSPMTIGAAVVAVVGSFAGGGACQADITRYAKDEKSVWISCILGYFGANSFIVLAGLICCAATGNGDLPSVMLQLGLGIPALLVLIAAQWTSNDNNLYTASLGFANAFHAKKHVIVIISGLAATFAGVLGVSNYFSSWLNILGTVIPPMAGIVIADYYILHKMRYAYGPGTKYSKVDWTAIIVWIVSAAAGFIVPFGISSINSLVAAFLLYIVIKKLKINLVQGECVEDQFGF